MSPTSTEQNEVQQPDTHAPNADANHDQGNDRSIEDRRGFFQRNPLAKPIVFLVVIVAVLAVGWFWWDSRHWENTDDAADRWTHLSHQRACGRPGHQGQLWMTASSSTRAMCLS